MCCMIYVLVYPAKIFLFIWITKISHPGNKREKIRGNTNKHLLPSMSNRELVESQHIKNPEWKTTFI